MQDIDIESGFFSPFRRLDIHDTTGMPNIMPIMIKGHTNRSRAIGKTDRVKFIIHLRMVDAGDAGRVLPHVYAGGLEPRI
jgi:hypothetical protein